MLIFQRRELVGRVERLVLDAGAGIVFGKGKGWFQRFAYPGGAAVPVGDGIADDLPLSVQQHKVNGPGVDAHGGGRVAGGFAGAQAFEHAVPQCLQVPAQVPVFFNQAVFKAIHFVQRHAPVLHSADDMPP